MRKGSLSLLLSILVLLCVSSVVFAQGTASRVTGTVVDQSGGAVPGAVVTLTNEATGVPLRTESTNTGTYVIDSVQVGTYTVTVEKQGFKRFVSTGNIANVNQPVTVNVTLEVGTVQEVVQVAAAAEVVQTSSSGNFGNTVEGRTLETLPIVGRRGRNPLDLVNLQPGVSNTQGVTVGGGVHVHGSRDRAFNFTLDGVDINESSAGGSNFTPLRPNPDSIEQFQVVTSNFTAELGRSSGAQVTFVTRSGTNDFHGTAFEFYQTPGLNANDYANLINTRLINGERVEQPRGQFVQHIFGGSLGGPIIKNKLFFFTNLQLLRSYDTALVTRTVYTSQARQGLFRYRNDGVANAPAGTTTAAVDASGNVIVPAANLSTYNIGTSDPLCLTSPSNCGLDPTTRGLIGQTPLPNNFSAGDGLNTAGFSFAAPQHERQYDFVTKIDYNLTSRSLIYGRYAQGAQNTFGDAGNGGRRAFPDSPANFVDTFRNPKNLAINYRWTPTANLTNEFIIGGNKYAFSFNNPDPKANSNPPFTFSNTAESGILAVQDPLNATPPINNRRQITTYQIADNLTWVTGAHTFKGGLNFRYQKHEDMRSSVGGANTNKFVNFSAPAPGANFNLPASPTIQAADRSRLISTLNVVLGRVGSISQAFVAQDDSTFAPAGTLFRYDARYGEYDFFAQDTWKFRSNLTLDLGLRWEIKQNPRGGNGNKVLVPNTPIRLGTPPTNAIKFAEGKLFGTDWNNFGPSVGFAWDPFKDGKTSVRANYRLAFDRINSFVVSSAIFPNTPGTSLGIVNTTFGASANEQGRVRFGIPALTPPSTPGALRQAVPFSTASLTVFDPDFQFPNIHQWGLSIQRELGRGFVAQINYVGRRATHLFGGYDVNQVNINASDARCPNETFLQAFVAVRSSSTANSCLLNLLYSGSGTNNAGTASFRTVNATALTQGGVASAAATTSSRVVSGAQMIATNTGSPSFFQPFPQFLGALNVLDSNDFSTYHGMELQVSRRFSNGLSLQAAYTWAKSLDTRSFDPTFTTVARGTTQSAGGTPFDIKNRRLNYARSDFDRRHSLLGYFVYDLPFGHGRQFLKTTNGIIDRLVGGWEAAGAIEFTSGRPFTVYSGVNTLSNVNSSTANCSGCTPGLGTVILQAGTNFYFDATQRAMFSIPAPGQQGNLTRNYFTTDGYFRLDLTLGKKFRITERSNLEFRAEMQNVTNHPSFDNPTATFTSSSFGRIRDSVVSAPRRIQLVMKFAF